MPNLYKRTIRINNIAQRKTREVTHYQYSTWPDHGAPEEADYKVISNIVSILKEARKGGTGNKVTVHCSAGIGRTGTIIALFNITGALEYLIQQKRTMMEQGKWVEQVGDDEKEPRISVFGTVRRLREQRFCMVQGEIQYQFIYEFMVHWLRENGLI